MSDGLHCNALLHEMICISSRQSDWLEVKSANYIATLDFSLMLSLQNLLAKSPSQIVQFNFSQKTKFINLDLSSDGGSALSTAQRSQHSEMIELVLFLNLCLDQKCDIVCLGPLRDHCH